MLRTGRRVLRNIYLQTGPDPSDFDLDVGRVDSAELAQLIVDAVNWGGRLTQTRLHLAAVALIGDES